MNYLFYLIFIALGLAVGGLCMTQMLIGLYFGLPFTKQLAERGVLVENNPIRKDIKKTVFIFLSISLIVSIAVSIFFLNYFMYYGFAVLAPLVIAFKQFKTTDINVVFYFKNYQNYIIKKNIPSELKKYYNQAVTGN